MNRQAEAENLVTLLRRAGRDGELREVFLKELEREHPTNQQSVMATVVAIIKDVSTYDSDLRNESAVGFARQVTALAALGQIHDGMPFI